MYWGVDEPPILYQSPLAPLHDHTMPGFLEYDAIIGQGALCSIHRGTLQVMMVLTSTEPCS